MKENFIKPLIKAILAGICISLGGTVYLSIANNVAGAIFFSFALFLILNYDYNLYTGKIGYLIENKFSYILFLVIIIVGNLIGTVGCGLLLRLTNLTGLMQTAEIMTLAKLDNNILTVLILSIFCGILMFVAVDFFRTKDNHFIRTLMIFLAVPIFILSKFEHSVANMFYFTVGNAWSMKTVWYTLIMITGNGLGAVGFCFLNKMTVKE